MVFHSSQIYCRPPFPKEPQMRRFQCLAVLGVVTFASSLAFGQFDCWSYTNPPDGHCSGAGGCEGNYPRTGCMIGCVSGGCNPSGNSTECCGARYDYAAGFNDGQNNCNGEDCGLIRVHLRARLQAETQTVANKESDPLLDYHPPRILFIVNKCTRGYEPFYERDSSPLPKGGM